MTRNSTAWQLVSIGICVSLFLLAGPIATAGQQLPTTPDGEPTIENNTSNGSPAPAPENMAGRLELDFSPQSDRVGVTMYLAYRARSEAEANAASNGTVNMSWFAPEELLQRLDNQTGTNGTITTRYESVSRADSFGLSGLDAEHGWVVLQYEAEWEGFVTYGEDVVIDETYRDVLHNSSVGTGWDLYVITPATWEHSTVGGDPVIDRQVK